MKTAEQIVDEFCDECELCDAGRERLVGLIDEALALARADERVKATAEALEKVGRTFAPRDSQES